MLICNKDELKFDPPKQSFDEIYCAGGLYGNPFALDEILKFINKSKCVFNGDIHWFDADEKSFVYIENNIKNQILLNGNVEMELCNYKSQTCGCNYPKNVCESTKIYADEIHKILKNAVKNIIPKDMETRPLTFSASVGNINIAFTHGDEKNLSGWGLSKESLEDKHRQIEIYNWLDKNNFDVLFSSHTCKKVFLDLEDKAILNNGSAGISNEGIYGIILRAGITPKSGAIFTKKIKNCFLQAHKILYDNDKFIKWFDKIWSKNSPANLSYKHRILHGLT